jgi:hypothetical protein
VTISIEAFKPLFPSVNLNYFVVHSGTGEYAFGPGTMSVLFKAYRPAFANFELGFLN